MQEIREELLATLERARAAQGLPWRDLTQTTLAELRFHALAKGWLPEADAWCLRRAFNGEMLRIYKIVNDVPLFPDL